MLCSAVWFISPRNCARAVSLCKTLKPSDAILAVVGVKRSIAAVWKTLRLQSIRMLATSSRLITRQRRRANCMRPETVA